jgi:methyltransferase
MAVSEVAFVGLLILVALLRGVELLVSRRRQRALGRLRIQSAHDPDFVWMVTLHTSILVGAALEVVLLHRPFIPALAVGAGTVFLLANALRWWVIFTLGSHWNVRVMDSAGLGVVTSGPFRLVRHPNYAAVFIELAALPLIHTAWLTSLIGSAAHVWVLSRRLAVEETVLGGHADYCRMMAHKPRFIPRLVGGLSAAGRSSSRQSQG